MGKKHLGSKKHHGKKEQRSHSAIFPKVRSPQHYSFRIKFPTPSTRTPRSRGCSKSSTVMNTGVPSRMTVRMCGMNAMRRQPLIYERRYQFLLRKILHARRNSSRKTQHALRMFGVLKITNANVMAIVLGKKETFVDAFGKGSLSSWSSPNISASKVSSSKANSKD